MGELWRNLKVANEGGEEDEIADAKAAIREAHESFRAEYGQDIREARLGIRDLKRQFREAIREHKETVDPEG